MFLQILNHPWVFLLWRFPQWFPKTRRSEGQTYILKNGFQGIPLEKIWFPNWGCSLLTYKSFQEESWKLFCPGLLVQTIALYKKINPKHLEGLIYGGSWHVLGKMFPIETLCFHCWNSKTKHHHHSTRVSLCFLKHHPLGSGDEKMVYT